MALRCVKSGIMFVQFGLVAVLLTACGGPEPSTLSISPEAVQLLPGGTHEFTASASRADGIAITWTSTAGVITGSGSRVTYEAPTELGSYRISATLESEPPVTASADVEVVAEPLPPTDPTLDPLADQRYITIVGREDFTPPLEPIFVTGFDPRAPLSLQQTVAGVPWISQFPPGNVTTSLNCGPASFLMVEAFHQEASLTQTNTPPRIRAIVDWLDANVAEYVAPHKPGIDYYNGGLTGPAMLETLARSRGIASAKWAPAQSQEILKEHLALNQPVLVRVHWQSRHNTSDDMVPRPEFGHWVVVVGMDSEYIYLHDPGLPWTNEVKSAENYGSYRRYTLKSFEAIWEVGPNGGNVAVFMPVAGAPAPVGIDKKSLQHEAALGQPFAATLSGSGGRRPYTWSAYRGSMPAGLSLTTDGRITGTPTSSGAFTFWVRLRDDGGDVAEAEATITVAPSSQATPLAIRSSPLLPTVLAGSSMNLSLSATGGSAPYAWTIAGGSLPQGLTLSQDGVISGAPTRATSGTFEFTARVRDTSDPPQTAERQFTLSVLPPAPADPIPEADLVIRDLGVSPSGGAAGSPVNVSFEVANQGGQAAGASTTRIRINANPHGVTTSDTLLRQLSTPSMAAGDGRNYNEAVTLPANLSHGTYYIWVTADVFNQAGQSNYANDKARATITVGGASDGCSDLGSPAPIPDAALLQAIRDQLGVASGPVTCGHVRGLIQLEAHQRGIVSLEGLQHAVNLWALNVWSNEVRDLSPLGRLTALEDLDVQANRIQDVGPLANLTQLVHLYLNSNQISDIGPLASLVNLQSLDLGINDIRDISPLANMGMLRSLRVDNNDGIRDLTPLGELTLLDYLGVSGNAVSDVSPLRTLTRLESLDVGFNLITDISALASLSRLKNLSIMANQIDNVSALQSMGDLEYLWMNDNRVTSLVPLVLNTGLGAGDTIDARRNCLDLSAGSAASSSISILRSRGATVEAEPQSVCAP